IHDQLVVKLRVNACLNVWTAVTAPNLHYQMLLSSSRVVTCISEIQPE
ncbi:hypothetical protein SOVF_105440, partial [Spinacia oleracea]